MSPGKCLRTTSARLAGWLAAALVASTTLAACDERALPPAGKATAPVAGPKVYERVVLSPVYEVDKIYKSMTGPQSTESLRLENAEPELLWVVGFEAIMMDGAGKAQISQEFMCHTNLDIDATAHREAFAQKKFTTGRLFTLSQGQYRIDMPKGFGIPILSSEVLNLNTQVLNLNEAEGKRDVRHKVVMRYVRDKEVTAPMKALYVAGAFGLKLLEGHDGHHGLPKGKGHEEGHGGDHEVDHTACLPGANAGQNEFNDPQGRTFTGHWVVPPGREVNHTRVTELMDLQFDTRIHYIAVHLHPFAQSLSLRDLTTGETLYEAKTRQAPVGVGLAHVDFLSSEEGIPVFKDHEYEMVSVYENSSGEPQDSMAVMNLYLADEEFKKPDPSKPPKAEPPAEAAAEPAGKLM